MKIMMHQAVCADCRTNFQFQGIESGLKSAAAVKGEKQKPARSNNAKPKKKKK